MWSDIIGYQGPRQLILVVDDHIEHRVLAGMLEPLGFDIIDQRSKRKHSPDSLLRPDLILMDLSMPQMDGWETSRLIHRNTVPATPIIVISANAALIDRTQRGLRHATTTWPNPCTELLRTHSQAP
jgi:CheY-like chemotaxis protein